MQCESLTKEILQLKSAASDSKRPEKSIYLSRDEGDSSSRGRNSCNDLQLPVKRKEGSLWKKEREEGSGRKKEREGDGDTRSMLKNSLSASRLHEDYYSGRSSRHKPFRNS